MRVRTFDEKAGRVQRFVNATVEYPLRPQGLIAVAHLRVLYGDTDQMGVVYYANYFRYFEAARGQFFRVRGGTYGDVEKSGLLLPVVDASCQYRAPAKYDDLLNIRATLSEVRRASLEFTYEVLKEGSTEILSTGRTRHACITQEGRPTAFPQDLLDLLTR